MQMGMIGLGGGSKKRLVFGVWCLLFIGLILRTIPNIKHLTPNAKHQTEFNKPLFLLHAQIAQHISKFNTTHFSGA